MKKLLLALLLLAIASVLHAQRAAPVRLAIVPETTKAGTVADVLTAEFTKNNQVHLLERAEIERVYREQGLSAANRDDLKLGRLLGADGLLLLGMSHEGTNQFLNVRLVAVKPGVVLVAERFPWPIKDLTGWSPLFVRHLDLLLPKLTVLAKDAIPISVVNLRSAMQSEDGKETERELKLLTIERLSLEPRLFVLERQRMEMLSEEKALKSDESAFWDGSYLLEGVVDQNGYSPTTMTINARLTPPKGGAPIQFEVSGSRTNLTEVVNRLATKITQLLKVNPTVRGWNANDEAEQYFEEAKWAMRWGLYPEARAAADSAWALGKHDLECAVVRISSYANPPNILTEAVGEGSYVDAGLVYSLNESDRKQVVNAIKSTCATSAGAVFAFDNLGIVYASIASPPDPRVLSRLSRALELYRDFSYTLSPDSLKPDSAWYLLGVNVLKISAETLQLYYLVPQSRESVENKLADLRALSRWIDDWLRQSPSVRYSYFVLSPNIDQERDKLIYATNIFKCELNWGCFWQDRPEDCVELYRKLLNSPAFTNFDTEFGSSAEDYEESRGWGLVRPRLIAWNEADRNRTRSVWDDFVRELNDSTNQFLRAEGNDFQSIPFPAGLNEQEILREYDALGGDIQTAAANILPPEKHNQMEAWDLSSAINDFVTGGQPTRAQAQELELPLAAYKSNLVRIMQTKSGSEKSNLEMAIKWVAGVQAQVGNVLNPVPPKAVVENGVAPPPSKPVEAGTSTARTRSEEVTNVLLVQKYFAIPTGDLPSVKGMRQTVRILNSRWCGGKLLLNLWWGWLGSTPTVGLSLPAIAAAIFDPTDKSWETILYPTNDSSSWPDVVSAVLFHGVPYVVRTEQTILDGNEVGYKEKILKYDAPSRQWHPLEIPMPDMVTKQKDVTRLWVVNNRLYGVNPSSIFEIAKNERALRLLASTRRHPAVSLLDSLNDLGSPVLFSGPNQTLCAIIRNESSGQEESKVFSWGGNDWRKLFGLKTSSPANAFANAVVFRYAKWDSVNYPSMIWLWDKHQAKPRLALYEKAKRALNKPFGSRNPTPNGNPMWKSTQYYPLANASVSYFRSNLFLYVDRTGIGHLPNGEPVPERGAIDADLICLDKNCAHPIVVRLKYDSARGPLPWTGAWPDLSPLWMTFTSDLLLIGNKNTPGIWAIPISELEAAVARQKPAQPAQPQANQSNQVESR